MLVLLTERMITCDNDDNKHTHTHTHTHICLRWAQSNRELAVELLFQQQHWLLAFYLYVRAHTHADTNERETTNSPITARARSLA